jgi:hypothetical protein
MIRSIVAEYGRGRFVEVWLKRQNLEWAIELLEREAA